MYTKTYVIIDLINKITEGKKHEDIKFRNIEGDVALNIFYPTDWKDQDDDQVSDSN